MRGLFAVLLLWAVALGAGDLTGKWAGSFETKTPDGPRKHTALLILKQDGARLEGSGGPNESEQFPIRNGKLDGDRITFEVDMRGRSVPIELAVRGDRIEGDLRLPREDGSWETSRLVLERVATTNATGKWSGAIRREGQEGSDPALMILKQEGTSLTGSGGPNEERQFPIEQGKIEGNRLTFQMPRGERGVFSFDVTITGDRLEGTVTATRPDGATERGKLLLNRVAEK